MASIERDDVEIHFDVVGEGFPLVLFPGAGGDASVWHRAGHVAALREQFTCVVVDPRGFGRSATPPDPRQFAPSEHARDVVAIADAIGFDRFAMWGHSHGGADALFVASLWPDRVAAAVVAGMWLDDMTDGERRAWYAGFAGVCRERGWRGVIGEGLEAEGLPTTHWLLDLEPETEALARQIDAIDEIGVLQLGAIQAPTLFLIGELEDPEQNARRTAGEVPHGRAVHLPGLGHLGVFVDIEATLPHAVPVLTGVATTA